MAIIQGSGTGGKAKSTTTTTTYSAWSPATVAAAVAAGLHTSSLSAPTVQKPPSPKVEEPKFTPPASDIVEPKILKQLAQIGQSRQWGLSGEVNTNYLLSLSNPTYNPLVSQPDYSFSPEVKYRQSQATPTEQAAAKGRRSIEPYVELGPYKDLIDPRSKGLSVGTPTELASGFGYGVSSAVFRGPDFTTIEAGDAAILETKQIISYFGVLPSFLTPYVASGLGLTDQDLIESGYVLDPLGNWVLGEYGVPGGGDGGGGNGGGSIARRTASGARSTGPNYGGWGPVHWRIGA